QALLLLRHPAVLERRDEGLGVLLLVEEGQGDELLLVAAGLREDVGGLARGPGDRLLRVELVRLLEGGLDAVEGSDDRPVVFLPVAVEEDHRRDGLGLDLVGGGLVRAADHVEAAIELHQGVLTERPLGLRAAAGGSAAAVGIDRNEDADRLAGGAGLGERLVELHPADVGIAGCGGGAAESQQREDGNVLHRLTPLVQNCSIFLVYGLFRRGNYRTCLWRPSGMPMGGRAYFWARIRSIRTRIRSGASKAMPPRSGFGACRRSSRIRSACRAPTPASQRSRGTVSSRKSIRRTRKPARPSSSDNSPDVSTRRTDGFLSVSIRCWIRRRAGFGEVIRSARMIQPPGRRTRAASERARPGCRR